MNKVDLERRCSVNVTLAYVEEENLSFPNKSQSYELLISTSNALLLSYSRLVKIIKRLNDILTSLLYFLFLLPGYLSKFTFFSEAIVV